MKVLLWKIFTEVLCQSKRKPKNTNCFHLGSTSAPVNSLNATWPPGTAHNGAKIPHNQASASHRRANSFTSIRTMCPAWQRTGATTAIINKHHLKLLCITVTQTVYQYIPLCCFCQCFWNNTLLFFWQFPQLAVGCWLLNDPYHGWFGISVKTKVKGTAETQT